MKVGKQRRNSAKPASNRFAASLPERPRQEPRRPRDTRFRRRGQHLELHDAIGTAGIELALDHELAILEQRRRQSHLRHRVRRHDQFAASAGFLGMTAKMRRFQTIREGTAGRAFRSACDPCHEEAGHPVTTGCHKGGDSGFFPAEAARRSGASAPVGRAFASRLCFRIGGRLAASEPGSSRGNHGFRQRCDWPLDETPDIRVAAFVGVGIAFENVVRHVASEIPDAAGLPDSVMVKAISVRSQLCSPSRGSTARSEGRPC